jgi:hypothetical protein
MYGKSTELKSSLAPSNHSRSAVVTNSNLETDRILETLTDLLFTLVDELFTSFPVVRESLIIKHYTEISKFLIIHNTNFEGKTMKTFEDSLKTTLKTYPWEGKLKNSVFSQWRNLLTSNSMMTLNLLEDYLKEILFESEKNLESLLKLCHTHLNLTQFTCNIFPEISDFHIFFTKMTETLMQKTLNVQKKTSETSSQPRIQRAQMENLSKKVQSRTEWINFSETVSESVDYEKMQKSLINCCRRCFKRTQTSQTQTVSYSGAPGWEITRVYLEITDGRFTDINILDTKLTENRLFVDVQVWFPKFSGKQVWFSMKVEGTSCRKRNFESTVSEIREFLVLVDSKGSVEISED